MKSLESFKSQEVQALLSDDEQSSINGGRKWTNHLGHSELDGQTVDYWQDCKNNVWTGFKDKCGEAYETHD